MDKVTFVRKVQDAIEKKMQIDRVRTEKMIGAVFSALSARLTPSEGEEFIAQLPAFLQGLWRHEVATRLDRGEKEVIKLSRDQFLAMIQTEGHLASMVDAEFIARCVIHVLKEAISPGEMEDAVAQLPSDLKEWVLAA